MPSPQSTQFTPCTLPVHTRTLPSCHLTPCCLRNLIQSWRILYFPLARALLACPLTNFLRITCFSCMEVMHEHHKNVRLTGSIRRGRKGQSNMERTKSALWTHLLASQGECKVILECCQPLILEPSLEGHGLHLRLHSLQGLGERGEGTREERRRVGRKGRNMLLKQPSYPPSDSKLPRDLKA